MSERPNRFPEYEPDDVPEQPPEQVPEQQPPEQPEQQPEQVPEQPVVQRPIPRSSKYDDVLADIFVEYLYKLDEIRKHVSATDLFVEIELTQLEQLLSGDKYATFINITNELVVNDMVSVSQYVQYTIYMVQHKFGKPRTVIKFTSIPVTWKRRIDIRLSHKRILDSIRPEILDYAQGAPMTPQMLQQNLFRKELSNMSISDVQEYLDVLCLLGIMKRRGVLYYLR
jgi:hypothetical protein